MRFVFSEKLVTSYQKTEASCKSHLTFALKIWTPNTSLQIVGLR